MVRSTRDGLVVVDATREGLPVIYANPAFETMTGYTTAELREQGLGILQGEEKGQQSVKEMAASIREGNPCEVMLKNYRKDGGLFWNQLRLVPVEENGELTWWVGVARDAGDIRKLKDRLESRKEQLLEARDLATADRLTKVTAELPK